MQKNVDGHSIIKKTNMEKAKQTLVLIALLLNITLNIFTIYMNTVNNDYSINTIIAVCEIVTDGKDLIPIFKNLQVRKVQS